VLQECDSTRSAKYTSNCSEKKLVGTAVKIISNSADSPGISVNGFLGFALQLKGALMIFVKFVKSIYF